MVPELEEHTMSIGRILRRVVPWVAGVAVLAAAPVGTALIAGGDFETVKSGRDLRRDAKGQDWYESRRDTKKGHALLKLNSKDVAGNKTRKAMIIANPDLNTYLSQRFAKPILDDVTVTFDICVDQILKDDNHSAFVLIGNDGDHKKGPNSTAAERFVFLGFENSKTTPGKMNLFAREGNGDWPARTLVARDLALKKWYTLTVSAHVKDAVYEVSIPGVLDRPVPLDAFSGGKANLKRLTHLSFASWNDGAGTFYIDNVLAEQK
jgi:hypothetical protein